MLDEETPLQAVKLRRPQRRFITLGRILSAILAVCTLLGVPVLYPSVVVGPDNNELDRLDASTYSFTIRNTGFITLTKVKPILGLCIITFNIPINNQNICNIDFDAWKSKTLTMDEPYTIGLGDFMKPDPGSTGERPELDYADISIVVVFQLWEIPYTMEREFRFYTELQKTGKMVWRSKPVE